MVFTTTYECPGCSRPRRFAPTLVVTSTAGVRRDVFKADLVLPSLDAAEPRQFYQANRPHSAITFDKMRRGLIDFGKEFPGRIWLEVFLLEGITSARQDITQLAALARRIKPGRIQLNTVSRPPAEARARAVSCERMEQLKGLFTDRTEVITESLSVNAGDHFEGPHLEAEIIALRSRSQIDRTLIDAKKQAGR